MKPVDPAHPDAPAPFTDHRDAALALLNSDADMTTKAAQFLGGLTRQQAPLTPAQQEWLENLLHRGGLPPLIEGE